MIRQVGRIRVGRIGAAARLAVLLLPAALPGLLPGLLRAEGLVTAGLAQVIAVPVAADPALRQISVTVTQGLSSNALLPDDALRAARLEMLAGAEIADADLRTLADYGDGLAAQRYVRRLLAGAVPADPSDIAYYATIAVSTGRVWTLPDAVAAMHRLDPATEPALRISAYIGMLYPHAWAGNALALDALIDLNGAGRLFGPLSEPTRVRILEQAALIGDGRAELRMALDLLQRPTRSNAEAALLRDYLARAGASEHLQIRSIVANIQSLLDPAAAVVVTQ